MSMAFKKAFICVYAQHRGLSQSPPPTTHVLQGLNSGQWFGSKLLYLLSWVILLTKENKIKGESWGTTEHLGSYEEAWVYEMSPQGRHHFTDVVEEIYDGLLLCCHIAYYFKKPFTASWGGSWAAMLLGSMLRMEKTGPLVRANLFPGCRAVLTPSVL